MINADNLSQEQIDYIKSLEYKVAQQTQRIASQGVKLENKTKYIFQLEHDLLKRKVEIEKLKHEKLQLVCWYVAYKKGEPLSQDEITAMRKSGKAELNARLKAERDALRAGK